MADATGGIQEAPKERAEGAEGKLGGGCFAFLIGLKHANATPPRERPPSHGQKSSICEPLLS